MEARDRYLHGQEIQEAREEAFKAGENKVVEWIKTHALEGYDQWGDEKPHYLLYIDKELWREFSSPDFSGKEQKLWEQIAEEARQLYWWSRQHPAEGESIDLQQLIQRFANTIFALIKEAGYHPGKAPLLTDEEIMAAFDGDFGV